MTKKAAKAVAKKKGTAKKKPAKKKPAKKAAAKKTTAKKSAVAKKKVTSKKTSSEKPKTKKKSTKKVTSKKAAAKKPVKKKAAVIKNKVTTKKTLYTKPTTKKKFEAIKTTKKVTANKTPKLATKKKLLFKKGLVKTYVLTRAELIKKIKGYSKKNLEHFRNIIIEKREEILEDLQSLKEQMLDPATGEYINENSPYSLHMAEQGTDAMEREKTFLYAQRENKFLGYLDDALKRIDTGTYGICIECIESPQHLCESCPLVPKARLEAVPHTQHCLPIKQRKGGR
ncbi:MAG: conjugal transfer protein TraR [Bacteroidetes bacterium]|nr:conjugal transfer protein TraR [Bacteroidota bacterium]